MDFIGLFPMQQNSGETFFEPTVSSTFDETVGVNTNVECHNQSNCKIFMVRIRDEKNRMDHVLPVYGEKNDMRKKIKKYLDIGFVLKLIATPNNTKYNEHFDKWENMIIEKKETDWYFNYHIPRTETIILYELIKN